MEPPDSNQPPEQLRYLYDRWQKEAAVPSGSEVARYRADYEREAGIFVARLLKRGCRTGVGTAMGDVVPPISRS